MNCLGCGKSFRPLLEPGRVAERVREDLAHARAVAASSQPYAYATAFGMLAASIDHHASYLDGLCIACELMRNEQRNGSGVLAKAVAHG